MSNSIVPPYFLACIWKASRLVADGSEKQKEGEALRKKVTDIMSKLALEDDPKKAEAMEKQLYRLVEAGHAYYQDIMGFPMKPGHANL